MKSTLKETNLVYLGLFLFFCITSILSLLSTGTYDGGDSIQHFLISKYSFKHPDLFFHHWGKPFFTLISSPFSQFGIKGICIFNTLCATLTGLIVYNICKQLQLQYAWLGPLFALFTPIYYVVIISGLTEIFFAFILCLSILLFIKQKFSIGAIVISFLPFVRSEGYLLLPLFAFILVYHKKWLPVLFLGSGFIIYSIAGYFFYHDILWVIHGNPYHNSSDIYGHGSIFWFASQNEFLFGIPLVGLCFLGITSYFTKKNNPSPEEIILIVGGFGIYFISHSIFWWKGIFGSLGLLRVIAAITPLSAIIALRGFNLLIGFIKNNAVQKTGIVLIILLVIWMPFKQHRFPRRLDHEGIAIKEAVDWIKENGLENRRIVGLGPCVPLLTNKDLFDINEYMDLWYPKIPSILTGDIIIWDSHFCALEGRVELNNFMGNPSYKQLTKTNSSDGKKIFEVYVFEKL